MNLPKLSNKQKQSVLNEVAFMAATGNLYQSSNETPAADGTEDATDDQPNE